MAEAAIAFGAAAVVIVIYLAILGLGIADYIISSLAIHGIAKSRGISNPWLAWLPIGRDWTLGSVADNDAARGGGKLKWRIALMVMSIISCAAVVLCYVFIIILVLSLGIQFANIEPELYEVLGLVLPLYLILIVVMAVAMLYSYCKAICIYKIFETVCPEKAIKYIILSLLVPLAGSICLLKCRNLMTVYDTVQTE